MSARSLARRMIIDAMTLTGTDARHRGRLLREPGAGRCVRIALGHATPKSGMDAFRRQIEWASKHFEIIDFARFKTLCTDPNAALRKPGLLFTFDDGLLSNAEVGATVLEEFGARGVFFVVPGFSALSGAAARAFFRERIQGNAAIDDLPMTPAHMRELADRGHTIGNHTRTHTRLSQTPESELHDEIVGSAAVIEDWIGRPVETFAWTFAWDAITPRAYEMIRARHAYCFSPCPGLVRIDSNTPKLVWRTNVEAFADLRLSRFMCSGLGDVAWASRRTQLAAMLGQNARNRPN